MKTLERAFFVAVGLLLAFSTTATAGPARSGAPKWAAHHKSSTLDTFKLEMPDQSLRPGDDLTLARTLTEPRLGDAPVLVVARANVPRLLSSKTLSSVTEPLGPKRLSIEVSDAEVRITTAKTMTMIPIRYEAGAPSLQAQDSVSRAVAAHVGEVPTLFDMPIDIIADIRQGFVEIHFADKTSRRFTREQIFKLNPPISKLFEHARDLHASL